MQVATWNVEWKLPASSAGQELLKRIQAEQPQVLCLTETYKNFLPAGHHIESQADYGYPLTPGKRKVILWSRNPWELVDQIGSEQLPSGRFVSGTTETPIGSVRFIGVCIPWRAAHVSNGRRDKQPWEDHLAYLSGLWEVLAKIDDDVPTVVLGDFNQRIPRRWSPPEVYEKLIRAFGGRFHFASQGLKFNSHSAIDHIALMEGLQASDVRALSNIADDGSELTDHFGVAATVSAWHRVLTF